jgi:predicted permease
MWDFFRPLQTLLRTSWTYVIVSTLVLATSIGAFLAASALLDALVWRLPSGRATEDLVAISTSLPGGIISRPDVIDLQEQLKTVTDVCAFDSIANVAIEFRGRAISANCSGVTGNYFNALGVEAEQGRVINAENDRSGSEPVVVLSAALAEQLHAQPDSLVRIDAQPFRVVGILSAHFQNADRQAHTDAFIPLIHTAAYHSPWVITSRDVEWLRMLGRRQHGQSLQAINAELAVVAARLQKDHPDVNHGMGLHAVGLRESRMQERTARIVFVLSAAVVTFFALGFLNFFTLTLIRLLARRRQIAVRIALGATPRWLATWLLGELGTLLFLGGAGGLATSGVFVWSIQRDPLLADVCRSADVHLGVRSIAVTIAAGVCAGAAVWAYALRAANQVGLNTVLKESSTAPRRQRAFTLLFAAQFALTLALVAISLSFVATLRSAATARPPFRTSNVLTVSVDTRRLGWIHEEEKIAHFHQSVVEHLRTLPGVISVSASNRAPLAQSGWTNVWVDGKDPALSPDQCLADWLDISSDYFETMGIPFLAGHGFTHSEDVSHPAETVISRAMAKRYWPGQDPLGKSLRGYPADQPHVVIGVVEDVPFQRNAPLRPAFYYPYAASPNPRMTYLVRTENESSGTQRRIQDAVQSLWPEPDPVEVKSISRILSGSWRDLTAAMHVVLWVAALGLIITGVGLYSFSHYTAAKNVRDVAIQLSLGATSFQIAQHHGNRFRSALLAGVALAVLLSAAALAASRSLQIALEPAGTWELIVACFAVAAITAIGLFMPLWQFAKLDLRRLLVGSD